MPRAQHGAISKWVSTETAWCRLKDKKHHYEASLNTLSMPLTSLHKSHITSQHTDIKSNGN